LLGGTLTEYLSWRWVLFINVPIAVLVLIGTGVLVPGDTERGTLDVPGAIAATLGIGSLIFALTRGNTNGWNDAGTLASFAAGAGVPRLRRARHAGRRSARGRCRRGPAQRQRAGGQLARPGRAGRHRLDGDQEPPGGSRRGGGAHRRLRGRAPGRGGDLRGG